MLVRPRIAAAEAAPTTLASASPAVAVDLAAALALFNASSSVSTSAPPSPSVSPGSSPAAVYLFVIRVTACVQRRLRPLPWPRAARVQPPLCGSGESTVRIDVGSGSSALALAAVAAVPPSIDTRQYSVQGGRESVLFTGGTDPAPMAGVRRAVNAGDKVAIVASSGGGGAPGAGTGSVCAVTSRAVFIAGGGAGVDTAPWAVPGSTSASVIFVMSLPPASVDGRLTFTLTNTCTLASFSPTSSTTTTTTSSSSSSSSSSSVDVYVNSPPSGGCFSLSPPTGVALTTPFVLSAYAWSDADPPLTFSFAFVYAGDTAGAAAAASNATSSASSSTSGSSSSGSSSGSGVGGKEFALTPPRALPSLVSPLPASASLQVLLRVADSLGAAVAVYSCPAAAAAANAGSGGGAGSCAVVVSPSVSALPQSSAIAASLAFLRSASAAGGDPAAVVSAVTLAAATLASYDASRNGSSGATASNAGAGCRCGGRGACRLAPPAPPVCVCDAGAVPLLSSIPPLFFLYSFSF